MAYYSYSSWDYDTGENQYTSCAYDVVPFQNEFVEYYPESDASRYEYDSSQFAISYSAYSLSDSKAISYSISPQTQYLISYSTTEFNEPDFVEYDPTPYDGGYDIGLTYGKPLPPSDDICYPRTTLTPSDLSGFSFGSVPSPYGKPISKSEPVEVSKPVEVSVPVVVSKDNADSNVGGILEPIIEDSDEGNYIEDSDEGKDIDDSNEGKDIEEYIYPNYECGYPWSGYDYYDYGCGNGRAEEKVVQETTYADTLEICESLFGYWPCLSKKNPNVMDKYEQDFRSERASQVNPWEQTAAYFFGTPVLSYEGR